MHQNPTKIIKSSKVHLYPTFSRRRQHLHRPPPPPFGAFQAFGAGAAPGSVAAKHHVLRAQRTAELGGQRQNQRPPGSLLSLLI